MEKSDMVRRRVAALRTWMRRQGIDAYLVPTSDPHHSEYIPDYWKCREWLTGFTGSAGLAVVTADEAALWTDSRYWLQAAEQLRDTPFVLMREGGEGVPAPAEWLKAAARGRDSFVTACPEEMLTVDMAREFGITANDYPDAFDQLWEARPFLPSRPIEVQSPEWAGTDLTEKLRHVANLLHEATDAEQYLFNDLADIAWLLNLRGADIAYNPVFLAYLTYNLETGVYTLFTHLDSLTPAAQQQLARAGVELHHYDEALDTCAELATAYSGSAPSVVEEMGNRALVPSPVEALRAVKNEAEIKGMREAMRRDGVAMVQFLRRLDDLLARGARLTEMGVDELLTGLRSGQPGFKELSFGTIAAYGPHGAVVHYEADRSTDVPLCREGLLLLDSGAQYDCGTTDITRTLALGPVGEEERRVYTLVLKGHLALARLQFPAGAVGLQLDLAARQPLWAAGYDFGHGTGHGVGAHLCVHEGPHQIRKNLRACTLEPFRAGMVVTDEPGIYVAGRFGVRIENTLLCTEGPRTEYGEFLRFESLTLCPYDLRPVDRSLLTAEEMAQIDEYHQQVADALMPLLDEEADREWLARATAPMAG